MGATLTNEPQVGIAGKQDFWLSYTPSQSGKVIIDVISALYYLPENFKLVITGYSPEMAMQLPLNHEILNRIKYTNEDELSDETALSDSADAVLYEGTTTGKAGMPSVNIDNQASQAIISDDQTHYTVSAHNPEAIASAALSISRATV